MGTRCQITVEGQPVYFYKHCDGYPEGVMPTLEACVKNFKKRRGFMDESYLMARIGAYFMADDVEGVTGYGYDTEIHGDIEYLYTVKSDFSITVEEK